jgi:hypothetical protein
MRRRAAAGAAPLYAALPRAYSRAARLQARAALWPYARITPLLRAALPLAAAPL